MIGVSIQSGNLQRWFVCRAGTLRSCLEPAHCEPTDKKVDTEFRNAGIQRNCRKSSNKMYLIQSYGQAPFLLRSPPARHRVSIIGVARTYPLRLMVNSRVGDWRIEIKREYSPLGYRFRIKRNGPFIHLRYRSTCFRSRGLGTYSERWTIIAKSFTWTWTPFMRLWSNGTIRS